MARTRRMSRDYRRRADRDGSGYCCPEGKGCGWCGDNGTFARRRDALKAKDAIEYYAQA